jgi:hypothetical membrane protein
MTQVPNSRYLRIGGAAALAAPTIAFICITVAIRSYPPFSWTNNALSDLGVQAGITAPVFNFGLVAAGVCAFIFATLGLFQSLPTAIGKAGAVVFAAATIALIAIGIFNENFSPTHYLVSVAFFVLAPIGLFILTCGFALGGQKRLAAFSVIIGAVAAAPWLLQFAFNYVPHVAIPEAASAVAVSVWAIVLGVKLLKQAA